MTLRALVGDSWHGSFCDLIVVIPRTLQSTLKPVLTDVGGWLGTQSLQSRTIAKTSAAPKDASLLRGAVMLLGSSYKSGLRASNLSMAFAHSLIEKGNTWFIQLFLLAKPKKWTGLMK